MNLYQRRGYAPKTEDCLSFQFFVRVPQDFGAYPRRRMKQVLLPAIFNVTAYYNLSQKYLYAVNSYFIRGERRNRGESKYFKKIIIKHNKR
jgi:hypothetical protein